VLQIGKWEVEKAKDLSAPLRILLRVSSSVDLENCLSKEIH
jgi:hypothetical protein